VYRILCQSGSCLRNRVALRLSTLERGRVAA